MAQPLWFIRRDDKTRGPYPAPVIVQHLTLGRLKPEDEVSLDGTSWFSIRDSGYFQAALATLEDARDRSDSNDWSREREDAQKRWLDERLAADPLPVDVANKRAGESLQQTALRQDHQETQARLSEARRVKPAYWAGMAALLILLALAATVFLGQGEQVVVTPKTISLPDCAALPADRVIWRGCDKRNARLAGARLNNARLAGVRLDSADLRGARLAYVDLSQASLRGADLTGADLRTATLNYATLGKARLVGARLDGAALSKTAWPNGRLCAEGSVGTCG